jgi:hypothetical protein
MKFWKYTLIAATAILSISSTMFYASCTKDSCQNLKCENGGTCAADFCNCPSGYDGAVCENKITDRYIGTYAGGVLPLNGQPYKIDTVDVYVSAEPMTLSAVRRKSSSNVYTGLLQSQSNTVVIPDVVTDSYKRVVNLSIKKAVASSGDSVVQCDLNVVEYTNGLLSSSLRFNGDRIK